MAFANDVDMGPGYAGSKIEPKPIQFPVDHVHTITRDFDGGTAQLRCGTGPIPIKVFLKDGIICIRAKDDEDEVILWTNTGRLVGTKIQHPLDIVFATKVFVLTSGAWDMLVETKVTGHLFHASSKWFATYVKDGKVCSSEVDKNGRFADGYLIRKL